MNMNTLLTTVRNAIAADAATKAWTNANYSKDHTVFVGVDTRNPPAASDCPCVVLAPADKDSGEERDTISHGLTVSCEIVNENTRTVSGYSNVTEYTGVQDIETFRQKVLAAINAIASIRITKVETIYESIMFFPSFMCDMTVAIETEVTFGTGAVE